MQPSHGRWRCHAFAIEGIAMPAIGHRRWAIAEGYIPSESSFSDPILVSHETACILNAGDRDAHLAITIYFADREPAGPFRITIEARRTLHLRFNDLNDPQPIPRDTDYASIFESDVLIVVQHTRLDSRHAEVALLSTVATRRADGFPANRRGGTFCIAKRWAPRVGPCRSC
jgi:hypothetical protein